MITFRNVSKSFREGRNHTVILDRVSLQLPSANIALIGAGGSGKTTVLRLICGNLAPNRGAVEHEGRASWPFGNRISLNKHMSGAENTRFLARIYGLDTETTLEAVREFSEVGDAFHRPMANFTPNMRNQLMFSIFLTIDFDIYLIDETLAVGSPAFREKCRVALRSRLNGKSRMVLASEEPDDLREFCDLAVVLRDGKLHYFENVDDAIAAHETAEID